MRRTPRLAAFSAGHLRVYTCSDRMLAPGTVHRHDLWELDYYFAGGNRWTFPGTGNHVDVRRHGLLLIAAGTAHSYDDRAGERCSVLIDGRHLADGILDPAGCALTGVFARRHVDLARDLRRNDIEQAFRDIVNEPKDTPRSLARIRQAVLGILLALLEEDAPAPRRGDRAGQVLAHIRTNSHRPLTLRSLAEETGTGYSALSRLIRQGCGESFVRHLTRLRIDRACGLLAATDQPIAGICFECGFNDLPHFYRTFRRLRRVAPGVFRQRHRQNPTSR